jgi:hypothetical protein
MPTVKVELEVWCNCGNGICHLTESSGSGGITVSPCEECLDVARDQGYENGQEDGRKEGYEEGYDAGYEQGLAEGQSDGV